jgi:hypothetical protein
VARHDDSHRGSSHGQPLLAISLLQVPVGGRASQGAAAIPLSTAENSVYALEYCWVGIEDLVEISLLNAFGRAGHQPKSGACCAGRQRTGSGIQQHGLGLLNSTSCAVCYELTK